MFNCETNGLFTKLTFTFFIRIFQFFLELLIYYFLIKIKLLILHKSLVISHNFKMINFLRHFFISYFIINNYSSSKLSNFRFSIWSLSSTSVYSFIWIFFGQWYYIFLLTLNSTASCSEKRKAVSNKRRRIRSIEREFKKNCSERKWGIKEEGKKQIEERKCRR
jgi:hypothetical protein